MTVRTADQAVVVDSPVRAGREVERMVLESGGYIEQALSSRRGDVRVQGRVPAAQLDEILAASAALGQERRRQMSGMDVRDQHSDLAARLRSTILLRDRLQQLLERAATMDEILRLEREIARLQTDIDALQSRLETLETRAALAVLTVSLERKNTLGPISVAGRGVARFFASLF